MRLVENGSKERRLFYSDDITGPFYGLEAMLVALHQELEPLGIEGVPKDADTIREVFYAHLREKTRVVRLPFTDEQYLKLLEERGFLSGDR